MIRYDEPYKIHRSIADYYYSDVSYEDILDEDNLIRMRLCFKESDLQYLFGNN